MGVLYNMYIRKKGVDANQHERLTNFTLRHKLKLNNNICIAVLYFIVREGYYALIKA